VTLLLLFYMFYILYAALRFIIANIFRSLLCLLRFAAFSYNPNAFSVTISF